MGGAYLPSTTAETLAVLAAFISSVNIAGESPKRRCLTVTPASYSNAEPNIYQLEPVIELVCVECTITSFQLSPVPRLFRPEDRVCRNQEQRIYAGCCLLERKVHHLHHPGSV
ncbi:hypothetical protein GOODEAATRI_032432 [Goodea atripinnis]|uniref:Uncharacterized protein n=1 Tax=Goodea atripinnis TaxID=208336 RepID=A0ABV0PTF6_9TELE